MRGKFRKLINEIRLTWHDLLLFPLLLLPLCKFLLSSSPLLDSSPSSPLPQSPCFLWSLLLLAGIGLDFSGRSFSDPVDSEWKISVCGEDLYELVAVFIAEPIGACFHDLRYADEDPLRFFSFYICALHCADTSDSWISMCTLNVYISVMNHTTFV